MYTNTQQNDCIITTEERQTLLHNMGELLVQYDYEYDDDALDSIIDEWASEKRELITAFKKHPNYVEGKFLIAFNCDYERTLDKKAIGNFRNWLMNTIMYNSLFQSNLPEEVVASTDEGCYLPDGLWAFFSDFQNTIHERTISQEMTELLEKIVPQIRPHVGEKTSRVINRLCRYFGFDKLDDYNREFAKFADGLNPLTIKRHTILSLNPLDYLTMSFGNSWASCHTIDKNNKRGMPNNYSGCYSSGTISYMLDGSSMVLYTVDAKYDGDDYWTQPKINRQMFHWGAEKLVQSRLYPQDNDGDKDAYAPYRNIVQEIISTIFGFPNLWSLSRGTEAAGKYINSYGTHYRDYHNFESCTLSRKQDSDNTNLIIVGHSPICIECGCEHNNTENINCCAGNYICEYCGCVVSDEDSRWVNDRRYCCDCVSYCDVCGEYELNDNGRYVESDDRWVCDYCLSEYYVRCYECDEYHQKEECTYIDRLGEYVCESCLDYEYTLCEKCGEYYRNDDTTYIDHLGYSVCDNCLNEHYALCDECGKYFPKDEVDYYGDDVLCDGCYEVKTREQNEEEC